MLLLTIDRQLKTDLRTLAKERGMTLEAFLVEQLRNLTIGMHITKKALNVLERSLTFTQPNRR